MLHFRIGASSFTSPAALQWGNRGGDSEATTLPVEVGEKFYYLADVAASNSAARTLQDGGTPPAAAITGFGWTLGTNAAGRSCFLNANAVSSSFSANLRPDVGGSAGAGSSGTLRSDVINSGAFAAGQWTFSFGLRSVTVAATGTIRLRLRVFRNSVEGFGLGTETTTTELTSSTQVGATAGPFSTSSDVVASVIWDAPPISLDNEYLFVELGVEIVTASSSASADVVFVVGSQYGASTPAFVVDNRTSGLGEGRIFAGLQYGGGIADPLSGTSEIGRPGPGTKRIHRFSGAERTDEPGIAVADASIVSGAADLAGSGALSAVPVLSAAEKGTYPSVQYGGGIPPSITPGLKSEIGRPGPGLRAVHRFAELDRSDGAGNVYAAIAGTVSGVAAMAGSGSLLPAGKTTARGAVAFAGAGALSSVGKALSKAVATLAGAGTLGPVGKELAKSAWVATGAGSFTLTSSATKRAALTLSGSGLLSGVGNELARAVEAFSGSGNAIFVGKTSVRGAVSFAGAGTFTAVGREFAKAVFAASGSGTLAGTDEQIVAGSVGASGVGSLSSVGKSLAKAAVTIAGSGSLTGVGKQLSTAAATFAGNGSLSGIGNTAGGGVAGFAGSATFAAAGSSLSRAVFSASGSGVLSASGILVSAGAVSLSGQGALASAARSASSATTNLAGSGSLLIVGAESAQGTLNVTGSGALAGAAKQLSGAALVASGLGSLDLVGQVLASGSSVSTLSGSGVLTVVGRSIAAASFSMSGSGGLAASTSGSSPEEQHTFIGPLGHPLPPRVFPVVIARINTSQVQTIRAYGVAGVIVPNVLTVQVSSPIEISAQVSANGFIASAHGSETRGTLDAWARFRINVLQVMETAATASAFAKVYLRELDVEVVPEYEGPEDLYTDGFDSEDVDLL